MCFDGVSTENFAEIFASCEWPALSCLELKDMHIADQDAFMCTRLSRMHLPVLLKVLSIYYCYFSVAAMVELVKAVWGLLRHVYFSDCRIGAAGVAQLVQASSNLQVLDISCCAWNFGAVSELIRGQWPLLHSLSLCEKAPVLWLTVSVERLLDGTWPVLSKLVLSPSDCEAAAFLLSGRTENIFGNCSKFLAATAQNF